MVKYKLGTMRKEQQFSVSQSRDGQIMVQSDKSIGTFDPATGEGKFTQKGCYFIHLSFAPPFTFPAEFVALCKDNCVRPGQSIGSGVIFMG
jgi:hypothetical protein